MKKTDILLIGAGGHANSCIDVLENLGTYRIVGLIGLPEEVGSKKLGYEIIGTDADMGVLAAEYSNCLISVGQLNNPELRKNKFIEAQLLGFKFPNIISPKAYVSFHSTIGDGTIVMHGAIINAGAVVGRNSIINTMALIEHDSKIGDNCHISTRTVINGSAIVEDDVFIGSSSVLNNSIKIGKGSVIGMGSKLLKSLNPDEKYFEKREK